jgi:hypothetical protein
MEDPAAFLFLIDWVIERQLSGIYSIEDKEAMREQQLQWVQVIRSG